MPQKYMSIKEFSEQGYVHEINRMFLHPLGLALEVTKGPNDVWFISGVWDCREDPEGINMQNPNPTKVRSIYGLQIERAPARVAALGYYHQPVLEPEEVEELTKKWYEAMGVRLSINTRELNEQERQELVAYQKKESDSAWTRFEKWLRSWFA